MTCVHQVAGQGSLIAGAPQVSRAKDGISGDMDKETKELLLRSQAVLDRSSEVHKNVERASHRIQEIFRTHDRLRGLIVRRCAFAARQASPVETKTTDRLFGAVEFAGKASFSGD